MLKVSMLFVVMLSVVAPKKRFLGEKSFFPLFLMTENKKNYLFFWKL